MINKTLEQFRDETMPKLSKKEMAERIGMSRMTYLKHQHNPELPRYFKLAAWCVKHRIDWQ